MVLNLRLMERAELTVKQAFGGLEAFEKYVNENVGWIFQQTERRYVNNKWIEYPPSTILLVGNSKVVLAKPRMNKESFYNEIKYVILTVLTATRNDRSEALAGSEVNEKIRIYDHGLLPATIPTTTETAPPIPARPEDTRAALREGAEQLNTKQHRIPTPVEQLLDRIQRGATVYFCSQTSDVIATDKTDAPCETCKQPTTPNTHPPVTRVLRRGRADTPYYCETAGCLIVGDETMRYCELCGEPNNTHKLNPITTQTPQPQHAEKETTMTAPKENEDKQRFIITPKCPQCNTNLVPCRGLYCPKCNHKLPPDLAVHPEVVVAIKRKDYDKLATHLKQATNVAWNQLLKGRKVTRTLNSMGQNLFIITVQDETRTSTLTDEQKLDSTLINTGIGRLTADPYELREARRMTDRSRQ